MIAGIPRKKILTYLGILIVALLLVLIFRIAYAYLDDFYETGSNTATIGGNTVDVLDFIESDVPLLLEATPENAGENGTNYSVTATPKVSLTPNNLNGTAEYNYSFHLLIRNNTFVYTVNESTPEIVLTITDPNGNEITDLPNLTYGTFNGVSGYDITSGDREIVVSGNYPISADDPSNPTIQEWQITLTFINLKSNQFANMNKSMNVDMIFSKDVETKTDLYALCSGYANLGECMTNEKDKDAITTIDTLSDHLTGDMFRYQGTKVNNYVCIGKNNCSASDDNMYRIIGITPEGNLKVMKNNSIGQHVWNENDFNHEGEAGTGSDGPPVEVAPPETSGTTDDSTSSEDEDLPVWPKSDMYKYLNIDSDGFYNSLLNENIKSKIELHNWKYGDVQIFSDATDVYNLENSFSDATSAYISLYSVSDILLAFNDTATDNNTIECLDDNNCAWIMEKAGWTMSQYGLYGNSNYHAWMLTPFLDCSMFSVIFSRNVYPVFYLKNTESITNGNGTELSPYIIN